MMKKVLMGTMMAAAMTAMISAGAMAEGAKKVESKGLVFEIPEEYADLVTVETQELDDDEFIRVSETASIEAAKANGSGNPGPGWLFTISRVSEDELKEMRCYVMEGREVFAKKDVEDGEDYYLIYNHPTDVRFVREQYDDIDEDMKQWGTLCEWASGDVRNAILRDNPGLEPKTYGNTNLDIYLARAAFMKDAKFEIRSLEFGTLDPKTCKEDDFIEDLTDDDVKYELVGDGEGPAGEYVVLAFVDDGVRFDFFPMGDDPNIIREVRKVGDEEISTIYRAVFKPDDDEKKTAGGIMQAWAQAIAQAK